MPDKPRKRPFTTPKAPSTHSDSLQDVRDTGNDPAWSRFYGRYAPFITATLKRHGVPSNDVEELVQDIMLALAKQLAAGRYDRSRPFHTYLIGFIHNIYAGYCRRMGHRLTVLADDFQMSESQPAPIENLPAPDDVFGHVAEAEWETLLRTRAAELLHAQTQNDLHVQAFLAMAVEERPIPECQQIFGFSRDNLYQIKRRLAPLYSRALTKAATELDSPPDLT